MTAGRPLRALRAEWTKLRTLPSTAWLTLLTVAGTVGVGFAVTGSLDRAHCGPPCAPDLTKLTLGGVRLGQVGIVVLAVLAVTAEYSTGTIHPTLTAVPRRFLVVLGKVGALAALGTTAGALLAAGSLAAGRTMLPGNGFDPAHGFPALSLADDLTRRAAIGTVLYTGLVTLLAAGLGLLLRDTAGAVTAALALLYGSPVVAMFVTDPTWQHRIHRFAPMDAGLSIQATRDLAAEHIGPWAGLGVLSLYAAAAVIAGLVMFQRRDTP
ncbi:ABC transporter permease [Micromonospora sp. MA102]|uniref:ABC transporter permease n=1 Tax=Micromonospora sp. MA102 TaxID=2952755 RepID=UPI0021C95EDA|nr:ABC transporter permease [Micromonospora sp. MA102]